MLGILERIGGYITSLSIKGLLALSTSVCAFVGVTLGEIFTGQWGEAGKTGVIAATIGAAFVVIPKVMEQHRESKKTYSEIREKEISSTVERLSAVCEREKAFLNLQIAELNLAVTLERNLKHDAIAFATEMQSRAIILIEQLRKAHIDPIVELKEINYRELSGKADKTLTEMKKKTVETARDAIPVTSGDGNGKTTTNEK